MKTARNYILMTLALLIAGVATGLAATAEPTEIRAMSFNIRNGKAKDGENRWELRKDLVGEVIHNYGADVLGLQEAYRFQVDALLKQLPAYSETGKGRDGGSRGEHCSILYLKERFKARSSGTFWLSGTPKLPSADWGNRYKRICTWVRLQDKDTGQCFYVYNTHLDHQSEKARRKGVRLIMQRISKREHPEPFLLMGDFNVDEDTRLIGYLKGKHEYGGASPIPLVDSWRVAHPDKTDASTVSRFTGDTEGPKIDYIFVTPDTRVSEAKILRTHRDGRYPSDHYPVTARLSWEPAGQ